LKLTIAGEGNLSERIREVGEKILNWLEEEGLSPEEVDDSNAHFNFNVKVAGRPFAIVQNLLSLDSVFVVANLVFTSNQLTLLEKKMNNKERKEYFWDLRLALLRNSELGDFEIKPNPPDDVREVSICSKRIFYNVLTKDTLIHAIHSVHKAVMMVIWMLERHAGAPAPKEKMRSLYLA